MESTYIALSKERLSIDIEAVRINDVTDCYASLRQIDSRGGQQVKRIVLDLSSKTVLTMILKQVKKGHPSLSSSLILPSLGGGQIIRGWLE